MEVVLKIWKIWMGGGQGRRKDVLRRQ